MRSLFVSILALAGLVAAAAHAADPKPQSPPAAAPAKMEWEVACEPDLKKHCEKDTSGDVRGCLAQHEQELSKECTKHFSAAGYRVALACGDDISRLCQADAQAGKLAECMNAKQAQLSGKCRAALSKGSTEQKKADAAVRKTAKKKAKKAKEPASEPAK